jgi:hypothetical protein
MLTNEEKAQKYTTLIERRRAYQRDYYQRNLETKREQGRRAYKKYYADPANRSKKTEWERSNKELILAKNVARNHIKRYGTLSGYANKYPDRMIRLQQCGFISKLETKYTNKST